MRISGPMKAAEIRRAAVSAQLDWSAVRRAKHELSVAALRKGGTGAKGYWVWALPKALNAPKAEAAAPYAA